VEARETYLAIISNRVVGFGKCALGNRVIHSIVSTESATCGKGNC
jgi:hypothetical protein